MAEDTEKSMNRNEKDVQMSPKATEEIPNIFQNRYVLGEDVFAM